MNYDLLPSFDFIWCTVTGYFLVLSLTVRSPFFCSKLRLLMDAEFLGVKIAKNWQNIV